MNDARIQELIRLRDEARGQKDFARADQIRDEIAAAGYVLRDTPTGAVYEKGVTFERRHPASIESLLHEDASLAFSIHVLYEGFPTDLNRFLAGLRAHNDTSSTEVVIVDNASADGEELEKLTDDLVRVIHLDREAGWAVARNAGLKCARGEIVVLVDLSIEPAGDVLSPLTDALADPSVGLAGPFDGAEVDALEGYLIATRRGLLSKGLFSEKFKWYRNADLDLSFQIRSEGLKAMVVSVPVRKHVHRGWEALDEAERAKRSKRNHYLFFDRWKGRHDLLLSHRS